MKKRIRIKDIADRAQVSRGTVDRVIHNRGNVAPEIKKKIQEVIDELNYEKNLIASTLAYNRTFHIGVLLPNVEEDPFWEQPKKGIEKALKSVAHYGLKLSFFYFHQYKTESFNEQSNLLLSKNVDAVLFAPDFFDEAIVFMEKCELAQIPYLQINSFSSEKGKYNLGYIGQDTYQSGILAARILSLYMPPQSTVAIIHMEKSIENAHHLIEKEKGFRDFISQESSNITQVLQLTFPPYEEKEYLHQFLSDNLVSISNLKGVLVSTSRAYMIADFFKESAKNLNIYLAGFDLIEKNISHLVDGEIDFLINQNSFKQGYYGFMRIVEYLLKQSDNRSIMNVPMDIVFKENYKYYLQATEELPVIV